MHQCQAECGCYCLWHYPAHDYCCCKCLCGHVGLVTTGPFSLLQCLYVHTNTLTLRLVRPGAVSIVLAQSYMSLAVAAVVVGINLLSI